MDKETLLSTLNEKLGETQLSERTLTAYIEGHPVAEGEEPGEAYFTAATTFLKSLEGQYRHDVAEGIEKGKKPLETPPTNPPKHNEESEELRKMRERVEALEKADKDRASAETQTELVKKVKKAMKEQNATDEYVLTQIFKGVTLDPAKSVADLTKEMLNAYDTEYKACRGSGAHPRNTNPGSGGSGESRSKRFFERVKKKEGWGAQKK